MNNGKKNIDLLRYFLTFINLKANLILLSDTFERASSNLTTEFFLVLEIKFLVLFSIKKQSKFLKKKKELKTEYLNLKYTPFCYWLEELDLYLSNQN